MPDSGQTQSVPSRIVTTPIERLPKSTSRPILGNSEKVDFFGAEYPPPENLDEYYLAKKQPYGFEYFGVDEKAQKVKSYQKWAQGIDDFVREEIEIQQLENTLGVYKNLIDEIAFALELRPEINGAVRLEKTYKWIKNVLGPQRKINRRKREILGDGQR